MSIVKKIAEEIIAKNLKRFYSDDFYHLVESDSKGACSSAMLSLLKRGLIKVVCDKRKPFRYGVADRAGLKKFAIESRNCCKLSSAELKGGNKFYRERSAEEQHRIQCADRLVAAMNEWRA